MDPLPQFPDGALFDQCSSDPTKEPYCCWSGGMRAIRVILNKGITHSFWSVADFAFQRGLADPVNEKIWGGSVAMQKDLNGENRCGFANDQKKAWHIKRSAVGPKRSESRLACWALKESEGSFVITKNDAGGAALAVALVCICVERICRGY
jgi:hypothetical protein